MKTRQFQADTGTKDNVLEVRYFSSMNEFHTWYDQFKAKLWEDDASKVDLVEGVYVETEEISMNDTTPPRRLRKNATFRDGVSYYYAS